MRTVNRKHPTLLIYVVGIGLPKGYGLFGYDHCKASQPMPLLCELCKLPPIQTLTVATRTNWLSPWTSIGPTQSFKLECR